jgi:hypothetical protein
MQSTRTAHKEKVIIHQQMHNGRTEEHPGNQPPYIGAFPPGFELAHTIRNRGKARENA